MTSFFFIFYEQIRYLINGPTVIFTDWISKFFADQPDHSRSSPYLKCEYPSYRGVLHKAFLVKSFSKHYEFMQQQFSIKKTKNLRYILCSFFFVILKITILAYKHQKKSNSRNICTFLPIYECKVCIQIVVLVLFIVCRQMMYSFCRDGFHFQIFCSVDFWWVNDECFQDLHYFN